MKDLRKVNLQGRIKDPEDKRDLPAEKLILGEIPLPPIYRINPGTFIYNQGFSPACTGYALAGMKTDEEFLQHKQEYNFSGSWVYAQEKKIDGMPNTAGSFLRYGLKILQQTGIKQLQPYWCAGEKLQPDATWKIKAYYRVDNAATDELIKQILMQYGTIVVGSEWYQEWMNMFHQQVFPKPSSQVGGHAYRITGWNDNVGGGGWYITNSWGRILWGIDGVAIMPFEVFRSAVLGTGADVWKAVDG